MSNVTITASANSTPPANTVIATCTLNDGSEGQMMLLVDLNRNLLGTTACPLAVSGSFTATAASNINIVNVVSASIQGGSIALLAGANTIGVASVIQSGNWSASIANSPSVTVINNVTASVIQSGTWSLSASIVNAPSVIANATIVNQVSASISNIASVVATATVVNQVSASISNVASVISTATVVNRVGASISGGSINAASVTVLNDIGASILNSPSVISTATVINRVGASISGGSVAILAGANVIGAASAIQSTPAAIDNAWPTKLTDGTDTVAADSASRLSVYQLQPNRPTFLLTRPSNTTAYAIGDVISSTSTAGSEMNANGFAAFNGGKGRIKNLTLIDSASAATPANLEVWVFSASFTNDNDNSSWSPTFGDLQNLVATIPLGGAPRSASNSSVYQAQGLDIPYTAVSGSTSLWWSLVVLNAYTPTSAEQFFFNWGVEQL